MNITITYANVVIFLSGIIILFLAGFFLINKRSAKSTLQKISELGIRIEERDRIHNESKENITNLFLQQQKDQQLQRSQFDEHQIKNLKLIIESLQNGMSDIRSQIITILNHNSENLSKSVDQLTKETNSKLEKINEQVEKRLMEGFEKTTATFADVVKRLALIDEAQKKITELSSNVVSLQEVLSDKRSRGAFGEVQLSALLSNVIPHENFALQHTLSNGKRADCILFLPEPTGNVVIDAKFPLESYQKLIDKNLLAEEHKFAEQQFKVDIRKHIQDIAEKYIIPGETSDGALMFIPAEAVFAEIHAYYPDLVELSHKLRVWLVSPTTMMAILTTARAVLKDAATRKQIHIIQKHLVDLSKDFERFQKRMDNLAKHINLAHDDIEDVHQSSKKITSRFNKIEKVELPPELGHKEKDDIL